MSETTHLSGARAQFTFTRPCIKGVVTTVGANKVMFADEASKYGLSEKETSRLSKAVGLESRQIVSNPDTTTSDLCMQSAKKLLIGLNVAPKTIQGLIFVSQSPDFSAPATAISLQNRLGLPLTSMAFDLRLGCSGFVYGLSVAFSLIESGLERVILCVGDVASQLVDSNDHSISPIMGDAGAAILIERANSQSFFQLYSDGSGEKALFIPNSGARKLAEYKGKPALMQMEGSQVFNFTLQRIPSMIEAILDYANVSTKELDYLVMHQPNKYILTSIQKRLAVEDSKFPKSTQSKFGNQNSASIPGTISGFLSSAYSDGRLKSLFAGFGIGLSWGACILETDKIYAPPVFLEEDEE